MQHEQEDQWSIEVSNTSRNDRSNIRRPNVQDNSPGLSVQGCRTLYEVLRRGKELNPLGPCFGFRAVSTSSGFATPFIFSSYTECVARVESFAAGLDRLNVCEKNEDGMLLLGIYLKNCVEWAVSEHAIFTLGGATVPLYDTLGPSTVEYISKETGMTCVVCLRADLDQLLNIKSGLKHVILVDGVTPDIMHKAKEAGLTVCSFAKVESIGSQIIASEGFHPRPPCTHDLATFCYTSGTTGNPKGAMLSHQNLISGMAGVKDFVPVTCVDRYLSYLPLAHIMERLTMANVIAGGAAIGFYRGDPLLLMEDVIALRPTLFVAAPRVLNKIHDKIKAGITAAGGLKLKLFQKGMQAKTDNLIKHGKLTHSFYDKLIFNKIKHALGFSDVKCMISGSAPLSPTVMLFFRCMLGVPVVEGYGQTEGAAIAAISHPSDLTTYGHVGGPVHPVEMILLDVPEMGYLHSDTSHRGEPCKGRGEICIRGPNVFLGYYKNIKSTNETIDKDGWLHSGDIGMFTPSGQLKIIDRRKNIFKLSQGEYIAPEKIENILMQSNFVSLAFVYGDSLQSALVAIIVPDEDFVINKWNNDRLTSTTATQSFDELCKETHLNDDMLEDLKQISKQNGLHGFEQVKAIYLEAEPFNVESGLVTPTFKLKRQQLREYYQNEINMLYEQISSTTIKSKL